MNSQMDPQMQLAFQFASELSKQLITVAAGILALSVTFAKDVLKAPSKLQVKILATAWALYSLSIMAGFWSLMALTGSLADSARPLTEIGPNARIPAAIQILIFVAGTIVFMFGGILSLLALVKVEANTPNRGAPTKG